MISIGNDIIALRTIDITRTLSFRFYSKILSVSEQQLYQEQFTGIPFELFVWLLWSVKESVYKCLQRRRPGLTFSPVKIGLTRLVAPAVQSQPFHHQLISTGFIDAGCFCSEVLAESQTFYARSVIFGAEAICTVAQPAGNAYHNRVCWGIKQIAQTHPENQSTAVRAFLLEKINTMFPGQQVSIEKSASGYPFIVADGKEQDMAVSLSHHGEYAGYAIVV